MKTLLSTKKLQPNQRELLLNAGVSFVEYDAISIEPVDFEISKDLKNTIITSQNGAIALIKELNKLSSLSGEELEMRYFSVGEKTTTLLEKNGYKVVKKAKNGAALGHYIAENHKNESFHYFCGKQRRNELPTILKEAGILCNEIVTYQTHKNERTFNQSFDGVLFYSPSGVQSYFNKNKILSSSEGEALEVRYFCIGETTATEARKHTNQVIVSNATTIESTIAKAVNTLKKLSV